LRPVRESASSLSSSATTASTASLAGACFFADFGARLGATASVGAAWNIGTGIAAAFLRDLGAASVSAAALTSTSVVWSAVGTPSDFLLDFLTARLRGDFGSIAMAPNPLARICYFLVAIHILVAHSASFERIQL
jgi:hypothetical protein